MGWGRYFLLGDFGQQLDLADQKRELEEMRQTMHASQTPGPAAGQVRQLQGEVDELRLYLAALVRLMTSKGMVSQGELQKIVDSIDAQDGQSDGRFRGPIR